MHSNVHPEAHTRSSLGTPIKDAVEGMVAEPVAKGGGRADAVPEDGHAEEDAGDVGVRRDGVLEGEDGAAGLGRECGEDPLGAAFEITFIRGIWRHLDDVDLPLAGGGVAKPEMPLQATLGRAGEVAELQAARSEGGGDGETLSGVERGGVNVKVDVKVTQQEAGGEGTDKANLGAAGFPTLAEARGAKQSMRVRGGTVRPVNQNFRIWHGDRKTKS